MPWLHGQRPGAARRATGFPCPRQYMHDDDESCRVVLWMPPAFLRPLPLPWLYLLPVKKPISFPLPCLASTTIYPGCVPRDVYVGEQTGLWSIVGST